MHKLENLEPGQEASFLFGKAADEAFRTVARAVRPPMPHFFLATADFYSWASFAGRQLHARTFAAEWTVARRTESPYGQESDEGIREFHAAFAPGLFDEVLQRFLSTQSQIHHPSGAFR